VLRAGGFQKGLVRLTIQRTLEVKDQHLAFGLGNGEKITHENSASDP
jgi:hypothetical protein